MLQRTIDLARRIATEVNITYGITGNNARYELARAIVLICQAHVTTNTDQHHEAEFERALQNLRNLMPEE